MLDLPDALPARHPPNSRWTAGPRFHPDSLDCEIRCEVRSGAVPWTTISTAGPIATAPVPRLAAMPLGCRQAKNPVAVHCKSQLDEMVGSDSIPLDQAAPTTCSEIGTPHTPFARTIHSKCFPVIDVRDRPCLAADRPRAYRASIGVLAACPHAEGARPCRRSSDIPRSLTRVRSILQPPR